MLNDLLTLHLTTPSIEKYNPLLVEKTYVHEVSEYDEKNMRLLLKKS
jgi:hypothetical protein